jgi:hypothetical protein
VKTYKTQKKIERDIKDGVLAIEGDVKFECSFSIEASIIVTDGDIDARNIKAWDIKAGNIKAGNIKAVDINAGDINAGDIDAWDISYYAVCVAYYSIKCKSIKARRENHQEPICLDGKLEIKDNEDEVEIKVEGKTVKISRKSAKALNLID